MKICDIETPTYVYDIKVFQKNVNDIQFLIRERYPNFRLGYSYKTNYFHKFLKEAKSLGLYAEVVSPQEFEMACAIQECKNNIIYNGVIDDFQNKLDVAINGGIVNIENFPELMKFVNYSNENRILLTIGVRVNFDLGNGLISRFGIDVDSPNFEWICNPTNRPYLNIDCVHFQFGGSAGGLRSPEIFRKRVRLCVSIARKLYANKVDIGGNIIGRMDKDYLSQFPYKAPTLEAVCAAIGEEMKIVCPDEDIMLITECGSALVTNAMHLLTTITNVNIVRSRTFITCDCRRQDAGWSANRFSPSCSYYGEISSYTDNAIVCGRECREEDVLNRRYSGPAVIGGKFMFRNIGAYSYSVTNDFITPGCSQVVDFNDIEF